MQAMASTRRCSFAFLATLSALRYDCTRAGVSTRFQKMLFKPVTNVSSIDDELYCAARGCAPSNMLTTTCSRGKTSQSASNAGASTASDEGAAVAPSQRGSTNILQHLDFSLKISLTYPRALSHIL